MLRLFVLVASISILAGSNAAMAQNKKDAKKEEKLTGQITCAKCDLGEADKCTTVIKTDKAIYYFDMASHKKYHGDVCQAAKEGTVTGTVKEEGGKKTVTVTKVEYKK